MIYLLLAILSSALVSIIMRLSTDKVKGNIAMLTMNYFMCTIVAAAYAGLLQLFPHSSDLTSTLGMGAVHGLLYLLSFVLFQRSVKKNGVVLSATFMKLGLLVPMVVSIFLFREIPSAMQITGFLIAVAAIILINFEKQGAAASKGMASGLIILLVAGGAGDAMAKIYEEYGSAALSDQFLFYTFVTALILCTALMLYKKQRPGKYEICFGLLIGIPNFFSAKFLLASLSTVPAVIAYPTYSVATLLVVTLAGVCFFKERLARRQWIALGIILIALALLNT